MVLLLSSAVPVTPTSIAPYLLTASSLYPLMRLLRSRHRTRPQVRVIVVMLALDTEGKVGGPEGAVGQRSKVKVHHKEMDYDP